MPSNKKETMALIEVINLLATPFEVIEVVEVPMAPAEVQGKVEAIATLTKA